MALSEWSWCLSGIFLLSLGLSYIPANMSEIFLDLLSVLRYTVTLTAVSFLPWEEQYVPCLFCVLIFLEGSQPQLPFKDHLSASVLSAGFVHIMWYAVSFLWVVIFKWIVA